VQFEYMMIAGGIGVVIGVFASLLFNNRESR
jgi:gas vesicle protein